MTLEPGGRLGVYEIIAPIGAGGMGEVYRARDTRLDRSVAIKVLPVELAANSAFKLRFEREAKTISSLSHPNICALYDVGESDSRAYLVMEYLDGETLADRLSKGSIPIDQVLKIGVEIASALDSAHRQGIIHRDLKPSNIMLTRSGAKLLDFGLARNEASGLEPRASDDSATVHRPLTDAGTILGTFQYMAPEQVEGQPADARTDIFALGAVLYEAATGQRAFEAKSRASLIAAILDHEPPPISVVRPLAPQALDRVVRACLRKDPAERIQTAHDLMLDLTWIRESSSAGEGLAVSAPRRRKGWLPALVIALLALTAIGFAALYARSRSVRADPMVFSILSAPGASNGDGAAVSPDGKAVAYYGTAAGTDTLLWIRRFSDSEPRPIRGTEGAQWPFWSPDSQWVAFFGRAKRLQKVNVATGTVRDIGAAGYGTGGAWNRSGTIVFGKTFNDALYRVNASGGEAVPVTRLDVARRESVHAWPQFLADGKHFAFLARTTAEERNQIMVASLDGGQSKLLVKADSLVGFDAPWLLYVRESTLYAHELDERALELKGDPVEVANNLAYSESWATTGASVSPAGVIAYYPVYMPHVEVRLYDRKGMLLRTLLTDDGLYEPRLSPDGKRLVVMKKDPKKGAMDLWVVDLGRDVRSRLSSGLANHESPTWSPDGTRVAWSSDRDGMYNLYVKTVDDSAPPVIIWMSDRDKLNPQWMPDSNGILTQLDTPTTLGDIYITGLHGEKPKPVLADEFDDKEPVGSPDGRWVAFTSRRGGNRNEVYVTPVEGGRLVQVSSDGGENAMWNPDGSEVLYLSRDGKLMSVPLKISGKTVDAGVPKALFELPRTNGDRPVSITSQGTFLVCAMNQTDTTPDHIDVLMNWRSRM
jgi:serine/threonine protein kinase/Tol biopolymer transport system component